MTTTTILLVDPSQVDRMLTARRLESRPDWRVLAATTPEHGLELLHQVPCDLLLLSPSPCHEEATILLRRTRDIDSTFPVIILSERNDIHAGVAQLCIEADAHLCKDLLNEHLIDQVERVLERTRLYRAQTQLMQRLVNHRQVFELENDPRLVSQVIEFLLGEIQEAVPDAATRMKIGISLEEALLNAMIHGNLEVSSELKLSEDDAFQKLIALRQRHPVYGARRVWLAIDVDRKRVEFTIRDEGPGFDVDSLPDPRDQDRLAIPAGRGILMMQALMDEVRFNSTGNEVRLIKWLGITPSRRSEYVLLEEHSPRSRSAQNGHESNGHFCPPRPSQRSEESAR